MNNQCRSCGEAGNGKYQLFGNSIWRQNLASLAIVLLLSPAAQAIDFQVQPSKLYMTSRDKSGAFTVINNGSEKLDCQVSVKEWSQDASGKDAYADTEDLVLFPKIMTIEPNGQRAIRIGVKGPQSMKERTFRLFVEEIPTPKKDTEPLEAGKIRAGLTIAIRFANPIFIAPPKPQENAVVETVELSEGTARAIVRNTGNMHIKLQNVVFRGTAPDGRELFSKEISGWYILQGMSHQYEVAVPKDACAGLATIDVSAKAENRTMIGSLHVLKGQCAP